ncbi:MAG: Ig-like domain-containing protein [Candidatus Pacearchaeota archaeon]
MIKKEEKNIDRPIIAALFFLFLFFLLLIILFIKSKISITISSINVQQEQNCNYAGGDWIISDTNVICENREINIDGNLIINGTSEATFNNVTLFIANSLFLEDNAKLVLNGSELSLNISDPNPLEFNISTGVNTNLTFFYSSIKNNASGNYKINISGYFNLINSNTSNQTELEFFGDKEVYLINSIISSRAVRFDAARTGKVVADNIIFNSPCQSSTETFDVEQNGSLIISNSIFYCTLETNEYANLTIENSNFNNISYFKMQSYAEIRNSNFDSLDLTSIPILNFTTLSNITNKVVLSSVIPGGDEPRLYGNITMPPTITWNPGSDRLIRYYPIYLRDQFGRPLRGWHVNITRNSDGALISNGTTDANGRVELNITFNASNYAAGNFTLAWNGTADINLLNNTPIIITEILPDNAPLITLNLPLNNTQFNNTQDISFNFTASDDHNLTLICSIYLDNVLNQTNSSVQNNTLTNFLIEGISYGSHRWHINCSDGSLSNVSETRLFSIADTLPPIYSNDADNSSGSVVEGAIVNVGVLWQDNYQLSKAIFRTNQSGSWQNVSLCDLSGNLAWCNVSINTSGDAGKIICWNQWANDSSGNINASMPESSHCFAVSASGSGGGGGAGGGGGGGNCVPNWQCLAWSACVDNQQTKLCIDLNGCEQSKIEIIFCNDEKLKLEGCRPIWQCELWGPCVNGFMTRNCNISNGDELYACIYNVLPPKLKNLTKQEVIALANQGELEKYFGYYWKKPETRKSCGTAGGMPNTTEQQQVIEQQPKLQLCVMPRIFFVLLIAFCILFFVKIILLVKLNKVKRQLKAELLK